jgi:hypothetical protein
VLQQKNFLADFFLLLFSEVVPHGHVPSKLKNRLPSLKNSMVPWWFFSGPEQVYSSDQLMPTNSKGENKIAITVLKTAA